MTHLKKKVKRHLKEQAAQHAKNEEENIELHSLQIKNLGPRPLSPEGFSARLRPVSSMPSTAPMQTSKISVIVTVTALQLIASFANRGNHSCETLRIALEFLKRILDAIGHRLIFTSIDAEQPPAAALNALAQ